MRPRISSPFSPRWRLPSLIPAKVSDLETALEGFVLALDLLRSTPPYYPDTLISGSHVATSLACHVLISGYFFGSVGCAAWNAELTLMSVLTQ